MTGEYRNFATLYIHASFSEPPVYQSMHDAFNRFLLRGGGRQAMAYVGKTAESADGEQQDVDEEMRDKRIGG